MKNKRLPFSLLSLFLVLCFLFISMNLKSQVKADNMSLDQIYVKNKDLPYETEMYNVTDIENLRDLRLSVIEDFCRDECETIDYSSKESGLRDDYIFKNDGNRYVTLITEEPHLNESNSDVTSEAVLQSDSLALVALYNATNGSNWINNENWLSGPVSSWYGVTVEGDRVTELRLRGEWNNPSLSGEIPDEIGQLSNLTSLDLSNNALTGTIPSEIQNLQSLQYLNLRYQSLDESSFPVWINNMPNLRYLYLCGCNLIGELPSLTNLINIRTFWCENNSFPGVIPSWLFQLNTLVSLNLNGNDLSGAIPSNIGQLQSLRGLILNWNDLDGNIPVELGQLQNLTDLELFGNELSGAIPLELAQLQNLRFLDLSYNQLSGSIPEEIDQLQNLYQLGLYDNQLSGSIPEGLCNLNLAYVDFGQNNFDSGSCSTMHCLFENGVESIYDETQTQQFGFSLIYDCGLNLDPPCNPTDSLALVALYNATDGPNWTDNENWLTGPVSSWYGVTVEGDRVTELTLNGDWNNPSLTGELPEELGQLSNLIFLNLEHNNLTGTIPSEIQNLQALQYLNLSNQDFNEDSFPAWINNMPNLRYLYLSNCNLSGELPLLTNLSNIRDLICSSNNLSGDIPTWLGQLNSLEYIDLSFNQLSGSVPEELGQLQNLEVLSLILNQLSGEIPSELGQLQNLRFLELGYNQLSGSIPYDFEGMTDLKYLYVHNNNLTGILPDGLCNLPLSTINFTNNLFDPLSCATMQCLYDNGVSFDGGLGQIQQDGSSITDCLEFPEGYAINRHDEVYADDGIFYDSGFDQSYSNNEDETIIFYPLTDGNMLSVDFLEFDLESGYDYLSVYNGAGINENTLIGVFSGTNIGTLTASNPEGALTFNFISDGSVTYPGWKAQISSFSETDPEIEVTPMQIVIEEQADPLQPDASHNVLAETSITTKTIPDSLLLSSYIDSYGKEVDVIFIDGIPPKTYNKSVAFISDEAVFAQNVPAFTWSFGCSATSAAMIAGYYDSNGYPGMYTGPTNGGVMPITNESWGTVNINGEIRAQCPLSATKMGLDGRITRGHVDDYWISYGNTDDDPFITNSWKEHEHEDCTADFMKTNQSSYGCSDGGTRFYYYTDGSAYDQDNEFDGGYGFGLFLESRGYKLTQRYNQYIQGYNGNSNGFSFQNFVDEIDAGRPVIIHVYGHSMVGVGYDLTSNLVYLHNTWDYDTHTMTWGGEYEGMAHFGVSVFGLANDEGQFAIKNMGKGVLSVSSVTEELDWLSINSNQELSFDVQPSDLQSIGFNIDWDEVGSSSKTGYITINSNDADEPSVRVEITVIPNTSSDLTVTPITRNVGYESGSVEYDITSSCSWTAVSDQEWCTVTNSGDGDGTLVATYDENMNTSIRTATITIDVGNDSSVSVSLTQLNGSSTDEELCFSDITIDEIENLDLTNSSINGSNNEDNELNNSAIVVYKTNEGRYGKLIVKEYGYNLTLKWVTYNQDGSIYSLGENLVIHGTFHGDLDLGVEHLSDSQQESDFWWRQVDGTIRDFVPENGALFAVYECTNTSPHHFHTVWEGTSGLDQMNIYCLGAKLDGEDLSPEDEIGIFDGDLCVGYGKIIETIDSSNLLSMIVSRDDGSENGYTPGNEISYKLWDSSASSEIDVQTANYYDNGLNLVPAPSFEVGATAFVELSATSEICITDHFNTGWNIFSANSYPETPQMINLFQDLIDNGSIVKIQDEQGRSIENLGIFGGWINNIGDIAPTEGYKIKVNTDCSVSICGTPVEYPFAISLSKGWNIIGFPQQMEISGMDIVQQLIDNGTLAKVQDESGSSIENLGIFGGWVNNIGNFVPGEGFKIKVTADDVLWIEDSYLKSTTILPELVATTHFKTVYEGNGLDHMNINLVELPLNQLTPGDELAVYDGELCVGSVTILPYHLQRGMVSIAASSMDETGMNGFTEGNAFSLKLWKYETDTECILDLDIESGTPYFKKQGSTIVSLAKYLDSGFEVATGIENVKVTIYPNPTDGIITIGINQTLEEEVIVKIYNQSGQVIFQNTLTDQNAKIDLSGNAKGIYFIDLISGDAINTEKIILK